MANIVLIADEFRGFPISAIQSPRSKRIANGYPCENCLRTFQGTCPIEDDFSGDCPEYKEATLSLDEARIII